MIEHITAYSCALVVISVNTIIRQTGIAEFAGLEIAGLENDGVEQEETYILHTMK